MHPTTKMECTHKNISIRGSYYNLGKFIYFHYMIHMEHNPIINLVMILFQKMVLCKDSILKLKTADNLYIMRSSKIQRNTSRIVFSKPINKELLKFYFIFTKCSKFFCANRKWLLWSRYICGNSFQHLFCLVLFPWYCRLCINQK